MNEIELIKKYWRERPFHFKQYLDQDFIKGFELDSFFDWCKESNESIRLFTIDEDSPEKTGRSLIIDQNKDVKQIYAALKKKQETFTFHMNGVEKVEKKVNEIREKLDVPFVLRLDDIIATLSTENSGIGYHSGHEDGFIIQLKGQRRWKVWMPDLTTLDYRHALLNPNGQIPSLQKPENNEMLIIDVITKPGDVLYIPPFFPHEGLTVEESLSLSVAWKGIAPITFIKFLQDDIQYDTTKSATLFEDTEDVKSIPNYWLDETLKSIDKSSHINQNELKEIINSFIKIQIENYQVYESNLQ